MTPALQQSWEDFTHVAEVIRRVRLRKLEREFELDSLRFETVTLRKDNESLRRRLQLARSAIVELTTKGK